MTRNGFILRLTYLVLTGVSWAVFLVIVLGSARESELSSLTDDEDHQNVGGNVRNDSNPKNKDDYEKDFGEKLRIVKLENRNLVMDIQKENEDIMKRDNAYDASEKKERKNNSPFKDKIKIYNQIEKKVGKNYDDKEKDKRRKILNEKDKQMKNKMGKKLKDQIKEHRNDAFEQIISDINMNI